MAGGAERGGALPHVPASSQAEAAFGKDGAGFGGMACACGGVCEVVDDRSRDLKVGQK